MAAPSLTVVGVGADGFLGPAAQSALSLADVVVGSPRQLSLVPGDAVRLSWPTPLLPGLDALLAEHEGKRVVVLASGDPMDHGIGATLARRGIAATVLSAPSSVSLACARMGWAVEEVDVVSAVARPLALVHPLVQPGGRFLVLSEGSETPGRLAALLVGRGHGGATMTVLDRLGAPDEARTDGSASDWSAESSALNIVAVACGAGTEPLLPRTPGLPDDAYEHDGQLTKREARALAVSRLQPVPGQLLWDVGGGAGSVGIEWMRTDSRCRAVAVEKQPERAARIARNAVTLGVPGLQVVEGSAPSVLAGLEAPDAVFIGGGATVPGLLEACWGALRPGGRLVAHAVTLESEQVVTSWQTRVGGELGRLSVSRAEPVGGFLGWRPQMPLTTWCVSK